ncbi:MAG: Lrp/AsnC family transcriptional regulator [Candidatus Aenigmarchaeota archaeon]|nr:Lrp/AsnC family transcriptional regulator [Candidatus Aenigmarchaeota archaeon]
MLAFILTNVELGAEEEVEKKILEIPEVEEAYRVYGIYDLVIKVKIEDKEKLRNVVFKRIRGIQGVRTTMALIASI